MPRVTIYLDADCELRVKQAARAAGVSVSRWLGDLVRENTAEALPESAEWPDAVLALAGAWSDFPSAEEIRGEHY